MKKFISSHKKSINEHINKKYNYLHIGSVQIGLKPLTRGSLDVAILLCLRDKRHNRFYDSLLGTIESSLSHGPIFFNCFPDLTVSLDDKNILDVLFLNVKLHGYDMKEGFVPITLVYRVQYKVMNYITSNFLKTKCDKSGETTLFLTDETKTNVIVPKIIQWSDITLPEKWALEKASPALPRVTPDFHNIIQHQTGKVELVFDRRKPNDLTVEDFRTNVSRRSFSVHRSVYTIKINVDYPFQTDLIGDRTTNVISSWHLRDDRTIQSEFPPDAPFKLKSKSDNPVLASPFKTKLESEPINSTDIKNLIEQSNYTNKYLQALEKI